ncbi:ATP-binding cassette domain-containing protein [Paenibacillus melissococcoides]|uniref:ATP-binding cassette domain-containing protein n=1 Tax=Paenibacillus melissococcoides TaxID=2912268 RepID=A0ABM9GCJ0_9BACL|nr:MULTISPECIES: ATP-binding cassette domain-containing protein [Paenibacillus]MEB9895025.1 ATP-binding cassette domain-containing protein [Bacillus cereus]GIO79022.1 ABC transporter ATP-binding protein [Paenibacillus dendritiformis]CAH8249547.1 ATP-binding cassette domain-containing protein [Paenibacillus melissococcoides]CAH8721095.1 ATP-binding cassette domain-containing protein [Paenibacillus melissococcoides]
MNFIQVDGLKKNYQIPKRRKGVMQTISGLFHREYETVEAIKDVSFQVNKGEIVGYIGPNGAGKSTTIKMMCGIMVPTAGTVLVNGFIPYQNRREHAKQIGVVFGQRTQLWWDIPVEDSFQMLRHMYKVEAEDFNYRLGMFKEILALDELLHVPVRNLSLGQKMRAEICAALLHNPSMVYLDEPTIGLDIVAKRKIREFIKEINVKYKTTIMLTTHDIGDLEELCSRIIVIDKGIKVFDNNIERLNELSGYSEKMILSLEETVEVEVMKQDFQAVVEIKREGDKWIFLYDTRVISTLDILSIVMQKYKVINYRVEKKDTEQIIHDIYTKSIQYGSGDHQ